MTLSDLPIEEQVDEIETMLSVILERAYVSGLLVPKLTWEQFSAGLIPPLATAIRELLKREYERGKASKDTIKVNLHRLSQEELKELGVTVSEPTPMNYTPNSTIPCVWAKRRALSVTDPRLM